MKLLRQVIFDLFITLFIFSVVLINSDGLNVILAILIVLLLLARLSVLGNKEMRARLAKKQPGVSPWFYHLLNGVNVALLLFGRKWLAALGWGLIWYLSWMAHRQAAAPQKQQAMKRKGPRR